MSSPLKSLLEQMLAQINDENDVHIFGNMEDNINSMFTEFESMQEKDPLA